MGLHQRTSIWPRAVYICLGMSFKDIRFAVLELPNTDLTLTVSILTPIFEGVWIDKLLPAPLFIWIHE